MEKTKIAQISEEDIRILNKVRFKFVGHLSDKFKLTYNFPTEDVYELETECFPGDVKSFGISQVVGWYKDIDRLIKDLEKSGISIKKRMPEDYGRVHSRLFISGGRLYCDPTPSGNNCWDKFAKRLNIPYNAREDNCIYMSANYLPKRTDGLESIDDQGPQSWMRKMLSRKPRTILGDLEIYVFTNSEEPMSGP